MTIIVIFNFESMNKKKAELELFEQTDLKKSKPLSLTRSNAFFKSKKTSPEKSESRCINRKTKQTTTTTKIELELFK